MVHDKERYWWFMQQCLLRELPPGWVREVDDQGTPIYFNTFERSMQEQHPNARVFRRVFNQFINQDKKVISDGDELQPGETQASVMRFEHLA